MRGERIAVAAAAVALLGLGFVADGFSLFQLAMALAYAVAIVGLVILTGLSGQPSLGHGAFFGIGAYAGSILVVHAGVPFPGGILAAGVVGFALGGVVGLAALRLRGAHLALATFALAVALPALVKLPGVSGLTGAEVGLRLPARLLGAPPVLGSDRWLLLLALVVWTVVSLLALNLVRSRTGRALVAIRDDPVVAAASGLPVVRLRLLAFALAAACAGMGGGLAAGIARYIAPESFTIVLSIGFLIGLVIGGLRSVPAALIGGLFMVFVPYLAEGFPRGMAGVVQGLAVATVVLAAPAGAAGFAARLALRRRVPVGGSAVQSALAKRE